MLLSVYIYVYTKFSHVHILCNPYIPVRFIQSHLLHTNLHQHFYTYIKSTHTSGLYFTNIIYSIKFVSLIVCNFNKDENIVSLYHMKNQRAEAVPVEIILNIFPK